MSYLSNSDLLLPNQPHLDVQLGGHGVVEEVDLGVGQHLVDPLLGLGLLGGQGGVVAQLDRQLVGRGDLRAVAVEVAHLVPLKMRE